METVNLEKFRALHDEAYLYINQGITQEKPDIDRKDVALIMYQRGLGVLDQALCADTEGDDEEAKCAQRMQEKMQRTRTHIEDRILEITNCLAPPIQRSGASGPENGIDPRSVPCSPPARPSRGPSAPSRPARGPSTTGTTLNGASRAEKPQSHLPTYSEATGARDVGAPPSYGAACSLDVDAELDEIAAGEEKEGMRGSASSGSLSEQGEVVFSLPQVQIFHISPCGEVTTPSYPETLHVIKFVGNTGRRDLAPAFIEVGEWTYPLVRGASPILKASYGGYMFPDLESGVTGSSVGLMFPDSTTQTDREILESLLTELTTSFKTQEEVEREYSEYKEFSGTLATGLVKGAEVVGKGMVKGAVKTSELLFKGTDAAKAYIQPDDPKAVDPRLLKGLEVARVVSSGACRVSGWMVSKVGSATMALGRLAAPHLERQATRALTHFSGQSNVEANSQLKIVGEVASGTLAAVSTLYMALENSSKILAKNLANNTIMIVSHKYGTDAAAVTDAAFATAGNSYLAFYNAAALGPKGIAKRAAKDTGKAFVGFDPAAANEQASRAPDQDIGMKDVLETIAPKEKRYPALQKDDDLYGDQEPDATKGDPNPEKTKRT